MKTKVLLASAVLAALCGMLPAAAGAQSPWSVHGRVDAFAFSLKAGAEYGFTDRFGLSGSIGVCVINPLMLTYAATGVSHLMPPDRGLQVDVEYGLMEADLNGLGTANPSAYWVPGAGVTCGYRFPGGHQVSLRVEAGALLGYDLGAWRNASFMPGIGIEYSWRKR
jgi:hypothetical protein